ncbi:MAG TPA: DUF4124 domain-containing protein [Aquabacterium sp.]|uniref:DUF4124 domain-containing protein n=1 Tax=Aquabacterium sp. TaxID=1872578 RepID=UPI002E318B27|nr:DUF4124 domain-containing protein [Aquabacterium sp.]HEX5374511.1 DUF4124 domain-containing protein [Aquabacterium sp.]
MDSVRLSSALTCCSWLLVAAMASPAHASQWKWKDADGRVQYSDRPPPAYVADKDILKRPAAAMRAAANKAALEASESAAPALKPSIKASDPELEAKKRQQEAAEAAKKKAEDDKRAKTRAEDCQRARNYQKSLNEGIRISRTNSQGEREILDDKARAAEQARARQAIEANCQSAP